MKILIFSGGIGNQIFECAFYRYLQSEKKDKNIYGVYDKRWLSEHNGLEVEKWTTASLPPSRWYATVIVYFAFFVRRLLGKTSLIAETENVMLNDKPLVHWAFHFDKRYARYCDSLDFKIDQQKLSSQNISTINEIDNCNSVFIHVRRGDYLSEKYQYLFKDTCTLDYYNNAIKYIKSTIDNPHFYVFSDDEAWVKENIKIDNATFVNWNHGEQSPLDMWLMSRCKAGIIANSTFSYWGARLGLKKFIVCPRRWYAEAVAEPDWKPEQWVKV